MREPQGVVHDYILSNFFVVIFSSCNLFLGHSFLRASFPHANLSSFILFLAYAFLYALQKVFEPGPVFRTMCYPPPLGCPLLMIVVHDQLHVDFNSLARYCFFTHNDFSGSSFLHFKNYVKNSHTSTCMYTLLDMTIPYVITSLHRCSLPHVINREDQIYCYSFFSISSNLHTTARSHLHTSMVRGRRA